MPLFKGKDNVGKNIEELRAANETKPKAEKRSFAQMLAIALSSAIGKKKK